MLIYESSALQLWQHIALRWTCEFFMQQFDKLARWIASKTRATRFNQSEWRYFNFGQSAAKIWLAPIFPRLAPVAGLFELWLVNGSFSVVVIGCITHYTSSSFTTVILNLLWTTMMPFIVARVLTSFIWRVAKLIIEHWRTYPQKRKGRYCPHAIIQM